MKMLEVNDLTVSLLTKNGYANAVSNLSFTLSKGEILGIAGESGSGKTMTALTLLGLLPHRAQVSGSIAFKGQELVGINPKKIQEIRGNQISMVFQDPMTALHPMLTIRTLLTEHMLIHLGITQKEANSRAEGLLNDVRIPDPKRALLAHPGQFSGGMRQRIAIAIALACEPEILLADEPTTALDVTVQAGILRLLDRLRKERDLSVIFITHDLGVLSSVTDKLLVMYGGREAESGPTKDLLVKPRHPYTQGILDSLPDPNHPEKSLSSIKGFPPELGSVKEGCAFASRCSFVQEPCGSGLITPTEISQAHRIFCPVDPLVSR